MKQIHIEKIEETIETISECYINKDIERLIENVSYLGEQLQPVSKELTPKIAEIISNYETVLYPIAEVLKTEFIKGTKYGMSALTDIMESTIEEDKKLEMIKAKYRWNKFNALLSVGFTKEEAMQILLEELKNKNNKLPSISIGNKKKSE